MSKMRPHIESAFLVRSACAAPLAAAAADGATSGSALTASKSVSRKTHTVASIFAVFAVLFAFALALAVSPDQALAKSYSMPKVDIQAQLETDGSLHVVEQRTFEFNGDYSKIWWSFSQLPSTASVKVNGVRLVKLNSDGSPSGDVSAIPSVSFDLKWRESDGPGVSSYSLDDPKNTVYVFFGNAPTNVIVELDYTIEGMAQAYDDVSEIYWQYLGTQWTAASENVTCRLELPVPKGTTVSGGDNVRAWGHGPAGGDVEINSDGSISASVASVKSGEYAELRVLVPTTWLTNLSSKDKKLHSGTLRLDTVVKEEKTWSDGSRSTTTSSLSFTIGCAAVCAVLLIWAIVVYFRFGREYEPDFKGKYFRKNPAPGLNPAILGRLWRWNREVGDDLVAAILHLERTGQVRIETGSYELPGELGQPEAVSDYCIVRDSSATASEDAVSAATLDLLFGKIAGGQNALWIGAVARFAQKSPKLLIAAMKQWQKALSSEVEKLDFFEQKGAKCRRRMFAVAAVLFAVALVAFVMTGSSTPLLFALPTAVLLLLIGNAMPRRTHEGNNLIARCKALRNWLRDFGGLDEETPNDQALWAELMVLAYQFGVVDDAVRGLNQACPQLIGSEAESSACAAPVASVASGASPTAGAAIPWQRLYIGEDGGKGCLQSASSFLSQSVNSAIETAVKSLQASRAKGSSDDDFSGEFPANECEGHESGASGAR